MAASKSRYIIRKIINAKKITLHDELSKIITWLRIAGQHMHLISLFNYCRETSNKSQVSNRTAPLIKPGV